MYIYKVRYMYIYAYTLHVCIFQSIGVYPCHHHPYTLAQFFLARILSGHSQDSFSPNVTLAMLYVGKYKYSRICIDTHIDMCVQTQISYLSSRICTCYRWHCYVYVHVFICGCLMNAHIPHSQTHTQITHTRKHTRTRTHTHTQMCINISISHIYTWGLLKMKRRANR